MQFRKLQEMELMLQGFFNEKNVDMLNKVKEGLNAGVRQSLEQNFAQIQQVKNAAVTFGELRQKGLFTVADQARSEQLHRELNNQCTKLFVNLSTIIMTAGIVDKPIVAQLKNQAEALGKVIDTLNNHNKDLKMASREEKGLNIQTTTEPDQTPRAPKPGKAG